jgi:hypothetical protein
MQKTQHCKKNLTAGGIQTWVVSLKGSFDVRVATAS